MDVVDLYAIVEYTCRLRETRTNCVKMRHVILQQFMKRFKSREYQCVYRAIYIRLYIWDLRWTLVTLFRTFATTTRGNSNVRNILIAAVGTRFIFRKRRYNYDITIIVTTIAILRLFLSYVYYIYVLFWKILILYFGWHLMNEYG